MESLVFLLPLIGCVIMFVCLRKERQHRNFDAKSFELQIKNLEAENREKIKLVLDEAEKRIMQAETKAQWDLMEMRKKAEQRIREEREAIRSAKEELGALTEKELIIECIAAMNTYASRIDRLENRMSNMSISLDGIIKKMSKEKKPYAHVGCMTDDDIYNVAQEAAKRIGRITDITVNDAVVSGMVISINKLSTWSFTIDFNDNGQLTGEYTVFSDNNDSGIPQKLAEEISKEIVYRLSRA